MADLFEVLAKSDDCDSDSLISRDHLAVQCVNSDGQTLLHIAAIKGHSNTLRTLLEKKGNPNTRSHSGATPLLESCKAGQYGIAEILLAEPGVDINLQDGQDQTPLHWAAQAAQRSSDQSDRVIESFLERGASVNAADVFLRTPFHWICHKGDARLAKCAIERFGADHNHRSQGGDTALHWACSGNKDDVVAYLLTLDSVDAGAVNHAGETPADVTTMESIKSAVSNRAVTQAVAAVKSSANAYVGVEEGSGGQGQSVFARRGMVQPANQQPKKMTIKLRK